MLSSNIESVAWEAIEDLLEVLKHDAYSSVKRTLFSWKGGVNYYANARETYAWRDAIEMIKANDLEKLSSGLEGGDPAVTSLMKSKPIMLRMAGEITNALIHSYTNRHRITFFQSDLTPS